MDAFIERLWARRLMAGSEDAQRVWFHPLSSSPASSGRPGSHFPPSHNAFREIILKI